jgi:hypothetical protein
VSRTAKKASLHTRFPSWPKQPEMRRVSSNPSATDPKTKTSWFMAQYTPTQSLQMRWKLSTQRRLGSRRMSLERCIIVSVGYNLYTHTSRRSWLTRQQDQDDRTMFHMFERYQGKTAFDAHNQQPIIQKLVHEWKYIRGVKAWFPPANLDTTTRLPNLQSTQEARSEI